MQPEIVKTPEGNIVVKCRSCRFANLFQQPYPYHAGFGDQGFLYNDAGDQTLIWSSFDPAFCDIVGAQANPWMLSAEQWRLLEERLIPSPTGGNWRFTNPARCLQCRHAISGPMKETIYYLQYDGSLNTEIGSGSILSLADFLKPLKQSAV